MSGGQAKFPILYRMSNGSRIHGFSNFANSLNPLAWQCEGLGRAGAKGFYSSSGQLY